MTAREWKPGDKALVEVEVEIADPLAARVTIADDPGYWVATEALRPTPAAGEAAPEDVIERAARVLARLDPGEDWPSNADLGGSLTGTRDDEYRAAMLDQARDLARAGLLADDGRIEAEIKAEGWDAAVRECHALGWLHDFALSDALARNPYCAARLAGTTDTEGKD